MVCVAWRRIELEWRREEEKGLSSKPDQSLDKWISHTLSCKIDRGVR